jgi:hypothetical protein
MSQQASHSAVTRVPVFSGKTRVRGLWQRELADGTIVYEAQITLGRRERRVRLDARTKTDAINEHKALRVDQEPGDAPRTGSLVPTSSSSPPSTSTTSTPASITATRHDASRLARSRSTGSGSALSSCR